MLFTRLTSVTTPPDPPPPCRRGTACIRQSPTPPAGRSAACRRIGPHPAVLRRAGIPAARSPRSSNGSPPHRDGNPAGSRTDEAWRRPAGTGRYRRCRPEKGFARTPPVASKESSPPDRQALAAMGLDFRNAASSGAMIGDSQTRNRASEPSGTGIPSRRAPPPGVNSRGARSSDRQCGGIHARREIAPANQRPASPACSAIAPAFFQIGSAAKTEAVRRNSGGRR